MEHTDFTTMTDAALLEAKRKYRNSRTLHAVWIGFLAGIVIFGMVAWSLSPQRKLGFLIPLLFPIVFIYRMLKNPKKNPELEEALKQRGLL